MSNIDLDIKNTSEEHIIERHKRRGIYLFPNIITTAGLFAGFYAIVAAMKTNFELACMALFASAVLDNLDGRVARLTGTQSAFGAQYDSLSDMVCFGMTPALMAYSWGLQYLGKKGWLVAFMYVAATGLRLARFNLAENQNSDKKFFIGLPCTSAAAVIAGMIWVSTNFDIAGKTIREVAALVVIALSLLMVSNLRYRSFKEVDLKGNVPFITIFLVVFIYALIAWDPPKILFSIFFLYMLSGLLGLFRKKTSFSKQNQANQSKVVAIK